MNPLRPHTSQPFPLQSLHPRMIAREFRDNRQICEIHNICVIQVEFDSGAGQQGPCCRPVDVVFAEGSCGAEEECWSFNLVV